MSQTSDNKKDPFFEYGSPLFSQAKTYVDTSTLVESYRRLQIIYGFSRALYGETESGKIPEVLLEALIRLVNLERGFVALFERGEGLKLKIIASHNIELSDDPNDWPVSKTMIRQVIKEGIPVLSSDTSKDDRYSKIQTVNLNKIRSVMCVPIGSKATSIGIIYLDNRLKSDSFNQSDLLFLTTLSQYLYLTLLEDREDSKSANNSLNDEQIRLAKELREQRIIGKALPLLDAYKRLRRVAEKELPVLLIGETGSGKELFARAVHKLNRSRSKHAFMALNIAALSETIIESELFGHEKGAFSSATFSKPGKFELVNGGTLFLDEVAEIPLSIQPKLLRVLETGEFERVGGTKQLHTNIRLVCATNKNLEDAVKKGEFRDDLYYRLKGATVELPPLRERSDDIPELIDYALEKLGSDKVFSEKAIRVLKSYSWPGNIRQLIRFIEEMDAISERREVGEDELPGYMKREATISDSKFLPLNDMVAKFECDYIQRALSLTGGNNDRAIELLGISRAKFFDRKKAYGL